MERRGLEGVYLKKKWEGGIKLKNRKKKPDLTRVGPAGFDLTGPGPVCLEPVGGFFKFEF